MSKLTKLSIQSFRQISNLVLDDLRGFNVLVGENSAGKTSVLEAAALFCRPLDPLELLSTARRREIKSSREQILDGVRWLFPQTSQAAADPYFSSEIRISGEGFHQKSCTVTYDGVIGDDSLSEDDSDEDDSIYDDSESDYDGSKMTLPGIAQENRRGAEITMSCETWQRTLDGQNDRRELSFLLWEDERYISRSVVVDWTVPVATLSPVAHRVEAIQKRLLSEAILSDSKSSIVEALRRLDPDIDNLEVVSRSGISSSLWVHHDKTGFSPVSTLGDGTRRALSIALTLQSVRGGLLLIDELETAIHRDALFRFFEWLTDAAGHFNVQVIATTHSLEAIDTILSVSLDDPENLVAYKLPGRESKYRKPKRFSGDILENIRFEQGIDVR